MYNRGLLITQLSNLKGLALFYLSLILVIILVSCQSQPQPIVVPSNTATITPPRSTTTITPTPTQTITPLLSSTSTLTITPSWTPLPTLLTSDAKALVLELLETNDGCKLPCWWGIMPGMTTWKEARHFLASFAVGFRGETHTADIPTIENVSPTPTFDRSYEQVDAIFPSPIDVPYISKLDQTYYIQDEVIIGFESYNYPITDFLFIQKILNDYGAPDQISIRTWRNEYRGSRPTSLIFYYHVGIMIEYVSFSEGKTINDKIKICPDEGEYNILYLWAPELNLGYSQAIDMFIDYKYEPKPRTLVDATGMSVQTFYELFRNSETFGCFETPADMWPSQ